jgi:hypothetical protein
VVSLPAAPVVGEKLGSILGRDRAHGVGFLYNLFATSKAPLS